MTKFEAIIIIVLVLFFDPQCFYDPYEGGH